jgi:hypothetical protein
VTEEEGEGAGVGVPQPRAGRPGPTAMTTPSSPKRVHSTVATTSAPAKRRKATWGRRRYVHHKAARATFAPPSSTPRASASATSRSAVLSDLTSPRTTSPPTACATPA